MSETTTQEPQAATSKQIKAACPGCDSDFVLEQLENEATLDQVKDAWLANLAEANRQQAEQLANAQRELDEAKAKSATSSEGVSPVNSGGNGEPTGQAFDDPIAEFNAQVKTLQDAGLSRQKAMGAVIKKNPDLHNAYLDAYRADVAQHMTI